jgi:hypothetical protein
MPFLAERAFYARTRVEREYSIIDYDISAARHNIEDLPTVPFVQVIQVIRSQGSIYDYQITTRSVDARTMGSPT